MTTVRYLTAAEWGMTWARPPVGEKLLDPECYVHHVGGGAWMDQDAVTVFRNLNTYAQKGKGYSALDYDVLVHYHRASDVLTIAEGRGPYMSAATLDRNEQGEAVCVCGNYTLRAPLPIEVEGTALGIKYGIDQGWIATSATILGHKDNPAHLNATGCPGDNLYAQLPTVRARVASLLHPTPIDRPGEKTMYLMRGPSGQMYGTDRTGSAFVVSENDGAYLRDVWGFKVDTDTGPYPMSAEEERLTRILAGFSV